MKVIEKIPTTWEERLAYEESVIQFEGTWEDFLEVANSAPFKVEFINEQIYLMGNASDTHELIVANMIRLLGNLLYNTDFRVYGSNRLIYAEECKAGFEPDVSTVLGESQSVWYKTQAGKKMQANLNPALVVEVFSKGTKNYDLGEKLPCYKTIPSLQQIIYLEQERAWASVYTRTEKPNEWLNIDLEGLDKNVMIQGNLISLQEIYRNVNFDSIDG